MKKTLLFLFFLYSLSIYSQFDVKGIVTSSIDSLPVKNVKVIDETSNTKVFTDIDGMFSIKTHGTIRFNKEGYEDIQIVIQNETYNSNIPVVISLSRITNLTEVLIEDYANPHKDKYATKAISYISTNDINRANPIELHPVLNRVSGVFMQNGTLNTNRITIRGIGARNLFGTANIKAYFGEIPLTDGNGESSIEDLELGALSSIEIQKGSSSSSYGVGLGGTILLHPEFAFNRATEVQLSNTYGSYGLRRTLIKASTSGKKANLNVLYSNNHTGGYRDNNEYDRNTITLTSNIHGGENDSFSIFGSYIDLKAGIPSSLNQEDFDNTPRQAAFTWGRSQAFEDVDYGILGITWKHKYTSTLSQATSIFGSFRNNYEPRPFNILEEESTGIGIRSRISGTVPIVQKELTWTIGGELLLDNYNGKTFENLYEDFPVGTGSVIGDQLSDLDEKRYYYNIFAEANYNITKKLRTNIGLHINQTFFDIRDRFLSDNEDNSGEFDFDPIFSPKLGISYELNYNVTLFGNIANGFSTPTTSETLLPDGLFNPDIKPEIGWNYEIGARYSFFHDLIYGTLSAYTLRVQDLLVSRRTVDDNFFAINAGKTIHNGIEFNVHFDIIKRKETTLKFFFNTSIFNHQFDDFIDLDNDFSGNDLTGVPSKTINIGLDFIQNGFYGNLNYQAIGKIPVNDANSLFSDNYDLVHAKFGYKNKIGSRLFYDVFAGANNILDTKYASQIQINARGFGGNAPRYFYPGLPFNAYGGINIKYRL
ncbi:TonB-dependent receptor [Aquimarina sp. AU474]|uniref:TonB-dependent receptor n=1 Tax=Aquimarina sp. AU474 TaxID=2108529 RepID=UPI000D690C2E|nr:TonB-dependent receptor [Aquimarina sp. AU474]